MNSEIMNISFFDNVTNKVEAIFYVVQLEVAILTVIFYLSLFGNLIVILVLTFRRKKFSRMSFYIMFLSIADINVAIFSILPQILWKSGNRFLFNENNFMCKVTTFFQVFFVLFSTYTLIIIARDRYNCICRPFDSYRWNFNIGFKNILVSVAIAAVNSLPQIYVFRLTNTITGMRCQAVYHKPKNFWEIVYLIFNASGHMVIPTITLIYYYIMMFIELSNTFLKKSSHTIPLMRISRAQMKTLKLSFCIVTSHLVATLPFYVMITIYSYVKQPEAENVSIALALRFASMFYQMNSFINPIIYLIFESCTRKQKKSYSLQGTSNQRTLNLSMKMNTLNLNRSNECL